MQGLIIKDYIIFSKKFKKMNRVIVLLIVILFLIFLKSAGAIFLGIVLPICTTGVPIILLLCDEKNNWDKYVIATPVSKRKIVLSRYISCIEITLFCSVFTCLINILSYFLFAEYELKLHLIICLVGFICSVIYLIFVIPTNYAFGVNGNSIIMLVLLGIISGGTYLMRTYGVGLQLIERIANMSLEIIFLVIFLWLSLLISLSILVSFKIYEKKHN